MDGEPCMQNNNTKDRERRINQCFGYIMSNFFLVGDQLASQLDLANKGNLTEMREQLKRDFNLQGDDPRLLTMRELWNDDNDMELE